MEGKYSYCPDCGRKSVYWCAAPRREDGYVCRYGDCQFGFYTLSGAPIDADYQARWQQANVSRVVARRGSWRSFSAVCPT